MIAVASIGQPQNLHFVAVHFAADMLFPAAYGLFTVLMMR